MNTPTAGERLDYLDAVRAFALLLGIVFHASLSFLPVFIGWAVMDVSTGAAVGGFVLVSHSFRMELFFLIAGFFSCMTLHRIGLTGFLRSRLVRIGVPFIVGWFLLRPLLVGAWVMGAESMRGEVDVPGGLTEGFRALATLPHGLFVGTHLWFLYYLLLITVLVLTVRGLVALLPGVRIRVDRVIARLSSWLARSPFSLPLLAIVTMGFLWFMDGWGMGTPDKSLVPDLPILGVYTLCFSVGWWLQQQTAFIAQFSRLTAPRWISCALAIVLTLYLSRFQGDPGHPNHDALRLAFVGSYAVMMWTLVALSIGLFRRFLDRSSAVVRYLADASYWLYLIHLPIVLWLQIAVAEWPVHWSIKLAGISLLTIGFSVLVYDLMVRSTFIGRVLNGRRRPRAIFRSRVAFSERTRQEENLRPRWFPWTSENLATKPDGSPRN